MRMRGLKVLLITQANCFCRLQLMRMRGLKAVAGVALGCGLGLQLMRMRGLKGSVQQKDSVW